MSEEVVELTGSSMEEMFCRVFEKEEHKPLSTEDMEMLAKAMFMPDGVLEEKEDFQSFHPVKVMNKRLNVIHNFKLDNRIMLFLMHKFEGKIACYVMTLTYIQFIAKKKGLIKAGGRITMEHFAMHVFPMGIPDDESYHNVWKSLKHTNHFFERLGLYESITL